MRWCDQLVFLWMQILFCALLSRVCAWFLCMRVYRLIKCLLPLFWCNVSFHLEKKQSYKNLYTIYPIQSLRLCKYFCDIVYSLTSSLCLLHASCLKSLSQSCDGSSVFVTVIWFGMNELNLGLSSLVFTWYLCFSLPEPPLWGLSRLYVLQTETCGFGLLSATTVTIYLFKSLYKQKYQTLTGSSNSHMKFCCWLLW